DGGVGDGAAGLERLHTGERGERMGGGHHAVLHEGQRAARVSERGHDQASSNKRVISSRANVGSGHWRVPSMSVTPCSGATTSPVKGQSIASPASPVTH